MTGPLVLVLVGLLTIVLLLPQFAGTVGEGTPTSTSPGGSLTTDSMAYFPSAPNPNSVPIKHVVILMMENHAFDNYFGTYCLTISSNCPYAVDGIPAGTCVLKNPSKPGLGCVVPFAFANGSSMYRDQVHSFASSHAAYANGSMDGFYLAEKSGDLPFGHWNGSTIPGDWDYAEEYGLGDYFFSSTLSYSLPNHWFLVASTTPAVAENSSVQTAPGGALSPVQVQYLGEANRTPAIDSELVNSSVSWKYYDWPLQSSYGAALGLHMGNGAFGFWDPLASQAKAYLAPYSSHFVARNAFYRDAAAGTLPNVSWVIPGAVDSDHPPYNVTVGMSFIMSVVGAVESSPEWNSTAVFVTWDEYGGFYDHVPPPLVGGVPLGFRVPLLVVSPYAREGYVGDSLGYFDSLLKFVEWRFGLGGLDARDTNAPLPLRYFDFSATPRSPLILPNASAIRYPEPLQILSAPPPVTNFSAAPGSGFVNLSWTPPVGGSPVAYYTLDYGPASHPTQSKIRIDGAADGYRVSSLTSGTSETFALTAVADSNDSRVVRANATPLDPALRSTTAGLGGSLTFDALNPQMRTEPALALGSVATTPPVAPSDLRPLALPRSAGRALVGGIRPVRNRSPALQ